MTQTSTTTQIPALAEMAAELLAIASARAGEVTIADEAISTARIAAGLCIGDLPRRANAILHTALADARTQVWRSGLEHADSMQVRTDLLTLIFS